MKPIIGFAGNGHLMEHSASAAFKKGFQRITYAPGKTGDHPVDLRQCDIVYVCPDRPSNIEPQQMVHLVLPYLKPDAILVLLCQVDLGFTRNINWLNVYYQVETLRIGDEEDRSLRPERIIIGTNKNTIDLRLLKFIESFDCRIISMSYESAELAKMAINLYLAAQVSTTNTLFELAEKIGADWNEIIPALQTDKRIGKEAYLKPGYGLSKHLERDLNAVIAMDGNMNVMKAFLEHSYYRRTKQQSLS